MIAAWPSPSGGEEYAVVFDGNRDRRLLILPALFDESNKLRHFTVEVMRLLDAAGMDCFLPDLPGCNESVAPLPEQTLDSWRNAAQAAASHFRATYVLAIRGGALAAPPGLPGWRYGAVKGEALLRAMLRARVLASREAGMEESREELLERGKAEGLQLAGYRLGPEMIRQLQGALPADLVDVAQNELGAPGLWLRAEPDHNPEQASALADLLARNQSE
ncbi:hypothetical protein FHS61_002213 [Altererythrobacter atlanticus]|uniref:Uncharacterized protein n=1 Tax=Croceibacterium atlanticum TaxID=1267766 RepID=A0A0F7KMD0_9SPHN|nr:hypothetical protein [Croceibacterium atlanticum]AKH41723.1 hypothetical protein WYH_00667 [Croceibacterium atlanticum]MBB5733187.1 hypothetical protein [Croceibacterium atlanticum]